MGRLRLAGKGRGETGWGMGLPDSIAPRTGSPEATKAPTGGRVTAGGRGYARPTERPQVENLRYRERPAGVGTPALQNGRRLGTGATHGPAGIAYARPTGRARSLPVR